MAILADFKNFPHYGRLVGIDWGSRRIGLAVSDERQVFVFPKGVLKSPAEVLKFMADESIVGIVVGLPLRGDGTESETTANARKFAADLTGQTDIPIVFIDESLTSMEAAEIKKSEIDSIAAAVILENAIAVMKRAHK